MWAVGGDIDCLLPTSISYIIHQFVQHHEIHCCSISGKTVFIWGGVRALERLSVQLCAEWGCKVTHIFFILLSSLLYIQGNLRGSPLHSRVLVVSGSQLSHCWRYDRGQQAHCLRRTVGPAHAFKSKYSQVYLQQMPSNFSFHEFWLLILERSGLKLYKLKFLCFSFPLPLRVSTCCFLRYDVVLNSGGLLSETLCLSLSEPETGRVVSALIQPPGFKE